MQRLALLFPLIAGLLLALACEPKKPARLTLDPSGPFQMSKRGQTERVKATAWDESGAPITRPIEVTFTTSDPSVATVDATGEIAATGSGKATITAEAEGAKATADVAVSIVGSVEIAGDPPKRMRYPGKPYRLEVVVKDDKGNVIEKPKLRFEATDYCVEVDDEGVVRPLTVGKCDVVVHAADKRARHTFEVR